MKIAPNLRTCYEHTEAEERPRTFVLGTAQDHGIICFSADVRQCNIAYLQVCFKYFSFVITFSVLSARAAASSKKAYLYFRLVCANGN